MSGARRFQLGFASIAVAAVLVLSAGTAGADPTAPTIPSDVSERVVSIEVNAGGSGTSRASASRSSGAGAASSAAAGAADPQVRSDLLAQTGSSTGLMVITGVILLVIGGSLLGGRRVYGD